jgi:Ca2+-binding EF-hand superfamily protein
LNTFKKLDNDGYIDRKELGMVMKSFDQDLNELELKEMVSESFYFENK